MPFNPSTTPSGLPDALAYSAARYTITSTKRLWMAAANVYADRLRTVATWTCDPVNVFNMNTIYVARSIDWEFVQTLSPEVSQLAAFVSIRTGEMQYWQTALSIDSETAAAGANPVTGDTVTFEFRSPAANRDAATPLSDLSYGTAPTDWDREVTIIGPVVVSPIVSTSRLQRLLVHLTMGGLCMAEMAVLGVAIYEVPYRTLEDT